MKHLTDITQFQTLLDSKSDFIVFKHSRTCNLSAKASAQVLSVVNDLGLQEIYNLDVLMTHDLKYEVADLVEVKHESPQVLIFVGGKLKAYASHLSVTSGWLRQEIIGWNDTRS